MELDEILTAISGLFEEDEYPFDEIIDLLKSLPEDTWDDSDTAYSIMETIIDNLGNDFDGLVSDLFPDTLWNNHPDAAKAVMRCILCSSHPYVYGVYPDELWDKDIAYDAVCADWNNICNIPDELTADPEVVLRAIDTMEDALYDDSFNMYPVDRRGPKGCVESLLQAIHSDLRGNTDFIFKMLERDYCSREYEQIYDWIDQNLWADKEFVLRMIEQNDNAVLRMSEELLADADIQNKMDEYIDLKWLKQYTNKNKLPKWLADMEF